MLIKIISSKDIFSPLNPKMKLSAEAGILLSELNGITISEPDQFKSLIINSAGGERRFQELVALLKTGAINPVPEAVFSQLGFDGRYLNSFQKENLTRIIKAFLAGIIQDLEKEKSKLEDSINHLKSI